MKIIEQRKRINSIDALRGFALFGILMIHCMEQFDLMNVQEIASPFWQKVDTALFNSVFFLFAGKAYAIFSLLFGLSFFMQMDSQASKGKDFRLRFFWRMILLLILGYINNMIYMGEFFLVYAILGIIMIPLFKLPTKWLIGIAIFMFLQIPDIITFVSLLTGNAPNEPTKLYVIMEKLYAKSTPVFMHGTFAEVIRFNMWEGLLAKLLWVINYARYTQLIGLFIAGMLIGRLGIHKNEEKMIHYSRKIFPYSIAVFLFFYSIVLLLPVFGVEGFTLRAGTTLFKMYSNLGMMAMYITGFMLLYYQTKARKSLDYIAPVGRMSATNYMLQGFIGVPLFYGFGLNLATELTSLQSLLVGLIIYSAQVIFSNLWMRNFNYGPIEWLWRTATWMKKIPMRRPKNNTDENSPNYLSSYKY
ncbi:MAG: DUF418 domain-containing protein [Bacteroidia bacterium]|nr:DUF418 domain-containing protein [Bacteroidia bacterium]